MIDIFNSCHIVGCCYVRVVIRVGLGLRRSFPSSKSLIIVYWLWQCGVYRPVARMKSEMSDKDDEQWIRDTIQEIRQQVSHNINIVRYFGIDDTIYLKTYVYI